MAIIDIIKASTDKTSGNQSLYNGVKNSSPQDGEKVKTPSKLTSMSSLSLMPKKNDWDAKAASFPVWREINVVPNFFNSMIIVLILLFVIARSSQTTKQSRHHLLDCHACGLAMTTGA